MTPSRTASSFDPTGRRRELARLVGQIQTLTLELQDLRWRELQTPEVDGKERTLERLRLQLAAVAKRTANAELGDAA
jgi:hypothetical protein